MCCEVRDVSMVWSYISQPPGQDSTAKGESLLGGVMFPPVWGDPPTFAAVLQHSRAGLLSVLLALAAKRTIVQTWLCL